ncbi:hypothetical protein [Stutzerimonas azotifigens]|uniref:hypothetical protein n=1 Tax=Stutzerimonas azotifigens TaxID=291995 RepID=UPI0004147A7B|nr:hypothetical protein [Stutzerimonas azotifigens]
MESESIVYGCIRDWPSADPLELRERRESNRQVLEALPRGGDWPFIGREMFSFEQRDDAGLYQTQVIHFGASYRAVEYEWTLWIRRFEALLRKLYWTQAVVHLETELNGSHTFRWETAAGTHAPGTHPLKMRCAWEREGGVLG